MKLEKLDDFIIKSCKKAKLVRIKANNNYRFLFSNFYDVYYDYTLDDYVICFKDGCCIDNPDVFAENAKIFGIMLDVISDIEFSFS